jgi:hypothetical protein
MTDWTDEAFGEFYETTSQVLFHEDLVIPRAVKRHRCGLCRRDIYVGETYRRQVGMFCGARAPWVIKEHLLCEV